LGLYFNPNNNSFKNDTSGSIYVDKTLMLKYLNRVLGGPEKCIAVSHARRFGKSQAAGMIDAYYSLGSDSRELFSKYKIAQTENWDEHLNKYNVIHLDMSTFSGKYDEDMVERITEGLYREFKLEYKELLDVERPFDEILLDIFKLSGIPFIIIIDEWDCVVRNKSDRPDLVHKYLQFLHDLFKSESSKSFLALGYITGILPIKKIKDESALNNFEEYTMLTSKELTTYFGFTEEEVKQLCEQYSMNYDSVKEWYNGYLIDGHHMYNPNSVYRAMVHRSLESYWKNTSAFSTINDFITLNYEGLKEDVMTMLAGGVVDVNVDGFQNDMSVISSKDDALTALIHLGYLGYDKAEKTAFIPNFEVRMAYQAALQTGNWQELVKSISSCDKLLRATINKDEEKVAELIELAHDSYTSVLKYNDENSLACTLTMAYFTAQAYYTVIRELPTGKGFADLVFIPRADSGNRPAIVIELKWNQTADGAIKQIKEKRYAGSLKGYGKKVILVGVNYDKDTKQHSCVIEEYVVKV